MKTVNSKKFLASTALGGALTLGLITGALLLTGDPDQMMPVPDPIAQQEMSQARTLLRKRNWKEAAKILGRNAVGSNVQAKYEYAMLYAKGWGVPRDLEKARNLLLQAVQRPFKDRARAAFELGRVYRLSKGEDCARIAFEWFTKAAKWGYEKAHNELGKSYARGIGVAPDIDQALKHYRIAAAHNSSSAVLQLVELLAKGNATTPANPERALAVLNEFLPRLEVAARAGDARAARCIGRVYSNNIIMKPNLEEAIKWLAIAAGLGDAIAMHDMALLILETKKEFAAAEDIIELLNESIERDYSAAITTLGRLHLQEKFGLPSRKAVKLFERGVIAGHPGSMEELGRLYLKGQYVPFNIKKAREMAEQGSRLKHAGSRKLLKEIEQVERKHSFKGLTVKESSKG